MLEGRTVNFIHPLPSPASWTNAKATCCRTSYNIHGNTGTPTCLRLRCLFHTNIIIVIFFVTSIAANRSCAHPHAVHFVMGCWASRPSNLSTGWTKVGEELVLESIATSRYSGIGTIRRSHSASLSELHRGFGQWRMRWLLIGIQSW